MAGKALVGILMGSKSDWENTFSHTVATLEKFNIESEVAALSAHRSPDAVVKFTSTAQERGIEVMIAGAGGAAHLPGVVAAHTPLPVLGVPVETKLAGGLDSLLSIVQMPKGIPVATFAVGKAGAINAAIFAAQVLAGKHPEIADAVVRFREEQTKAVLENPDPRS
ncbi:MAG: 5-(carboxyamino)imidazole ribonucleotide mutase [Bdellovibrionales bacterium]|nr:5-(carboxyamino)imidazole ribonucleotide mutase [Bdellovibrionales bacterium]